MESWIGEPGSGMPVPESQSRKRKEMSEEVAETSKRKSSKLVAVEAVGFVVCCILHCLPQLVKTIGQECVVEIRTHFQSLTSQQRLQHVLDSFLAHGSRFKEVHIKNNKICTNAWCILIGLPKSTFYYIRQKFENGQRFAEILRTPSLQPKSYKAMAWLERFAERCGDKMPDTEKVHLPSCMTRSAVYQHMLESLQDTGDEDIVTEEHFLKLWRENCSHISIPPISRFSKCDICSVLKEQIQGTMDKEKRKKLIKLREEHLQKQSAQRKKYYKHINKAKQSPSCYMSMIVDGMDQKKTSVPHVAQASKSTSVMMKLKLHLTGVLVHGIGAFGFFDFGQWGSGSNITINCILLSLLTINAKLPPVLYVQMDNSWKDNKNRFVLAFFALLVEKGIFSKIKVQFLMVGHTHEDVDQVFSRFSVNLRKTNCFTLDHLINTFNSSYHHNGISAQGSLLPSLSNFSSWLDPFINQISHHSLPHAFKFTKNSHGQVEMNWKNWSTDEKWEECISNDEENLLLSLPTGKPLLVEPIYEDLQLGKIKTDVEKILRMYHKEDEKKWWQQFFQGLEDEEFEEDGGRDLLSELIVKEKEAIRRPSNNTDLTILQEKQPEAVILGKHKKTTCTQSKTKGNTPQPGDMAVVYLEKYSAEWPQVCQVLEVDETGALVGWFKGSVSQPYTKWTSAVAGHRGRREQVTENIPLIKFVCWGFKLTKANKLPEECKRSISEYAHTHFL